MIPGYAIWFSEFKLLKPKTAHLIYNSTNYLNR